MIKIASLLLAGMLVFTAYHADAQEELNAEVVRMQESARTYLNRGDYANAIMMYNQAIRQAPGEVALRRDLAYAYYLSGDAKKAKEIIDPVASSSMADEQTYQLASVIESKLDNRGKAKKLLNEGLVKFPNSGVLFNSKGNMLSAEKYDKDALNAWNSGIRAEPSFPLNYYNAAKVYNEQNEPVWAITYGEIFVNLEPATTRTIEIKRMMVDGYRKLLSPGKDEKLPDFNASATLDAKDRNFTSAYKAAITKSAGAITEGLNTETLTMLRTRFMLEWMQRYAAKYPATLFTYQDKMLLNGYYDAYNQWLFGASDNSQEFSTWIKLNAKIYSAFESWKKNNPLQPTVSDPKPGK